MQWRIQRDGGGGVWGLNDQQINIRVIYTSDNTIFKSNNVQRR